jgi:hypothetical protein
MGLKKDDSLRTLPKGMQIGAIIACRFLEEILYCENPEDCGSLVDQTLGDSTH